MTTPSSDSEDKNKNTRARKGASGLKTSSITKDSDEDSQSDVRESKKKIEKLKKKIKSLQKEKKDWEAKHEELEDSLSENTKKQTKEINNKISELSKAITDEKLQKIITEKEEELKELEMEIKKEHSKTLDDLKKKHDGECRNNEEKTAELLTMRENIDATKEEYRNVMNVLKAREKDIMKLNEEKRLLKLNEEDFQSEVSTLEAEIQNMKNQIKSLQKEIKEAEAKCEELEESLNNNKRKQAKEIKKLQKLITEKDEEMEELKNQYDKTIKELKNENYDLKREENIQEMKGNYDKQIKDLEKENYEMIEEMATLNNNIKELRTESEKMIEELATLNKENQDLKAECEKKMSAIATLRDKIKSISLVDVSKEEHQRVALALKASENDNTKLSEEKRVLNDKLNIKEVELVNKNKDVQKLQREMENIKQLNFKKGNNTDENYALEKMIKERETLDNTIKELKCENEKKNNALVAMRCKLRNVSSVDVTKEEHQRVALALKASENDITRLNDEKRVLNEKLNTKEDELVSKNKDVQKLQREIDNIKQLNFKKGNNSDEKYPI